MRIVRKHSADQPTRRHRSRATFRHKMMAEQPRVFDPELTELACTARTSLMPTGSLRRAASRGKAFAWVDQIGFGKSSKPHAYQFTFQALAENTNGLLDHLGVGRVHVVGHSMGGMLGTRFALIFPDRTDRLVLVNPIGLEDWKTVVPYLTVDQ